MPTVVGRPGEPVTVSARKAHVLHGHRERLHEAAVWQDMPDGRRLLVTGSVDGTVRVWDGRTGREVSTFAHEDGVPPEPLQFRGDPDANEPDDPPFERHCVYAVDSYLAHDTGRLCVMSVGLDWRVNIHDGETGALLNSLSGHRGRLLGVACLWDGYEMSVVAVGREGTVLSWNLHTEEVRYSMPLGAEFFCLSHLRLPNGTELLAAGQEDSGVQLIDGHTGRVVSARDLHIGEPARSSLVDSTDLVLRGDGREQVLVAVAQNDDTGRISVWDVYSGDSVMVVEGHRGGTSSVSWVTLPNGKLLLASSGRDATVRIWDVDAGVCIATLDMPTEVGVVAWASPDRDSVMLAAGCGDTNVHVWEVSWAASPVMGRAAADGVPAGSGVVGLTATSMFPGVSRTQAVGWDVPNDAPPRVLAVSRAEDVGAAAVVVTSDRRNRRVLSEPDSMYLLKLFTSEVSQDEGQPLFNGGSRSVALGETSQGRLLVAADSGATALSVAEVTDGAADVLVATFPLHRGTVTAVALGRLPDGRSLVAGAYAGSGTGVAVWDVADGSQIRHLPTFEAARGMAFTVTPHGRTVLAAGGAAGVHLWESEDGHSWNEVTDPTGGARALPTSVQVRTVDWLTLPDGRMLLAAGLIDGRVLLWDFPDLHGPFTVATQCGWLASVSMAVGFDGQVWLAVGGSRGSVICQLHLDPPVGEASSSPAQSRTALAAVRSAAMPGLFALGQAGMWRPLGALEDVLTLTGAARGGALHDGRLAVLRDHAGVRRLRELNWPARARVALAGLLLVDADCGEAWAPPEGTGPAQWKAAFTAVPPAAEGAEPAAAPGVEELTSAAERIGERTVAMLTVLGPDAAAADPGLVLRLIGREHDLPLLGTQGLRLLTAASMEQSRVPSHFGAATHVPGAIGVSRHGLPDQLLQTQLALPVKVLKLRWLTDELLYREHSAFVPPRLQPVTLVLDTTPPTFGGAESLLRLVGHLVTVSLWQQGEHPLLVTAGRPDRAVELVGPAQLMELWTSRTLRPPDETLPEALDTAQAVHLPVVLLAHQYAPRPKPAPWLRLLTTHQPGERPVGDSLNGHHHFLPPDPPVRQLVSTVRALLADGERGTGR
ncbi:WD40 repeat domain-containing protein [Streptomyces sp. NBC_00035]|uniref:WD40 repeat domain-containing protein n=1 Tax=Streptomyces sp. NBC_00035 TaxID=2903614 RepID=UPI00325336EA